MAYIYTCLIYIYVGTSEQLAAAAAPKKGTMAAEAKHAPIDEAHGGVNGGVNGPPREARSDCSARCEGGAARCEARGRGC